MRPSLALLSFTIGALVLALGPAPGTAQPVSVERVAAGLDRPVHLTAPPDDFGRAFIVEQFSGAILVLDLDTRTVAATPFLTVGGLSTANEGGLLGLAFDPDYAMNGLFYVAYADTTGTTRIERYQVSPGDPDLADPNSAQPILSLPQPQDNHNGGWLGFGPDGYLYVAVGDGGGQDDDGVGHTAGIGNAQDTSNLLGSLLRIDVGGDDFPADAGRNYAIPASNPFVGGTGADEIWAWGLRNPWRPSFDRATGDLYIADVGQGSCEELNVQPATSPGGENYGWRLREGVIATPSGGVGGPRPTGAIDPFFDYPHAGATCSDPPAGFTGRSVTGGYVYRGPVASLAGRYVFADFLTARLWSIVWDGSAPSTHDGTNYVDLRDHALDPAFDPDVGSIDLVASFGEDAAGNLYVLDLSDGEVFLVPEPSASALSMAAVAAVLGLRLARRRAGAG